MKKATEPVSSDDFDVGINWVGKLPEWTGVVQRRVRAVPGDHARILEALINGDAEQARQAMDAHLAQTVDDLRKHVLSGAHAAMRESEKSGPS